jgi:hypothetical protein
MSAPQSKLLVFEMRIPQDQHEAIANALEKHVSDHVMLNDDRVSGHVKNPSDLSEFDFEVLRADRVKITVTVNPLKWGKAEFEKKIIARYKELLAMNDEEE